MDGDPAVEPELDSFSLTFPLPYRVAFIVVLGMSCHVARMLYVHSIFVPSFCPSSSFTLEYTHVYVNANLSQRSGAGASTYTTSTFSKSTCPR